MAPCPRMFGTAGSMRQAFLWALLPIVGLTLNAPSVAAAQVTTSITSSGLNTQVNQAGNSYDITGGTRPGGGPNLFHSFGDFNVGAGNIANFQNGVSFDTNGSPLDAGLPTSNILGRVTGGNISHIFGTIQTTDFGSANLFLMNPSGIVLGPGASLNVGGSVSFTTAQYIRLFDGAGSANFYANPANDGLANSILVMEPTLLLDFLSPAAYGFLTAPDPNGTITVQGSNLFVPSGQSISLIGGKVAIDGGAQLSAPGGQIHLATSASPGEFALLSGESLANAMSLQSVPYNPDDPSTAFTSYGLASMAPGSTIDVHGTGTVWIKGGQLVLSVNDATLSTSESLAPSDTISLSAGSFISTSNSGSDPGADVQITAGSLQADGAAVTTINSGDGNGGNISIDATTVGLTNLATILSSTGLDFTTFANVGFGDGGHVTANVGTLSITNGATITSLNFSLGPGQGGNVTIQGQQGAGIEADSVMLGNAMDAGSTISTFTASDSGRGGDVSITAKLLLIENNSAVSSDTVLGSGVGGDLSLNVGTLTLKGGDFGGSSIRSTNSASGTDVDFDFVPDIFNAAGGNVTIQGINGAGSAADTVTLSGGSQIRTETLIGGDGGRVSLATTSLKMGEASTITSETFQIGLGGDIVVSFQNANLSGEATIASRTAFADPTAAAGGTITLQGLDGPGTKADAFTLTGFRTGIISESFGSGDPGNVEVHAETVSLTGGAVIEAGNPQNTGAGGDVIINAGSVEIVGNAGVPGTESHISSQASGLDAGQVTITADQLTLDNGLIASSTVLNTPGRGGDMVLNVGIVSLTNGATINSSTAGTGQAGDITITAQSVTVADGSSITASSAGTGNAGQMLITSPSLTLNNGIITTSASSTGNAGSITAKANTVALVNGSEISSSSTDTATGSAGSITIEGLASPANTVSITDSALLTKAEGIGHGGSIRVDATNLMLNNATLSASVNDFDPLDSNDGPAVGTGNITFAAKYMTMKDSHTTADSLGTRNAGNISINSKTAPGKSFEMSNSQINTSAALADGGNVGIYFTDMIRLTDSTITSSVGNENIKTTKGGNITIDPAFFIAQRSGIRANAFAGTGGAIDITAGLFLADASSIVDASSTQGVSGTVQINSPINNLSSAVGRLPESLIEVQTLLRAACAARMAQGGTSSFVERGRDGIPTGPEGLLASPYLPVASKGLARAQTHPSAAMSGLQLRRLSDHASPAPATILLEHATCSS